MSVSVSGASRGCGSLSKGACYAGGTMGAGGTLSPWTWLVAALFDSEDYRETIRYDKTEVPPRSQVAVNPDVTLELGRVWPIDHGSVDVPDRLGTWGIADHVGRSHYTLMEFVEETKARGPSRRLKPQDAKSWVAKVPFPILFGFGDVPWFESQEMAEELLAWAVFFGHTAPAPTRVCSKCSEIFEHTGNPHCELARSTAIWDWTATWSRVGFGATTLDQYNDGDHPAVKIIEVLGQVGLSVIPKEIRPTLTKAIVGCSWINYIGFVGSDDEVPEDLANAGVQSIIVVDEDEAD